MLIGFISTLFTLLCIFLIFIILVQKGKGSLGIGNLGGGSQTLFGSSGGQDVFQKVTWVLGAILIFGSLGLAILKSKRYSSRESKAPISSERRMPTQAPQE